MDWDNENGPGINTGVNPGDFQICGFLIRIFTGFYRFPVFFVFLAVRIYFKVCKKVLMPFMAPEGRTIFEKQWQK